MKKVLVVDDEAISLLTLSMSLSDEGYEVHSAKNGSEALKTGQSAPPDVLVSDWKLGDEIDGLELAGRLSHNNPNLKSIILSGLSLEDLPQENLPKHLIFRFLSKPCSIDDVLGAVRDALA